MAADDSSWGMHEASGMETMNGVVRRLPVKYEDGSIDLIEIDGIFYLEAQGENTLIRTKRKKPYKSVQRLGELAKKLPAPAFVRCHREYIVNLNRVRSITPRKSRGYDLRLDPPVNRRIPIARDRLANVRKILGV
jgi:DNA-binding LytR/AlgR family response regulator